MSFSYREATMSTENAPEYLNCYPTPREEINIRLNGKENPQSPYKPTIKNVPNAPQKLRERNINWTEKEELDSPYKPPVKKVPNAPQKLKGVSWLNKSDPESPTKLRLNFNHMRDYSSDSEEYKGIVGQYPLEF
jgi:hypothetical protein